MPFDSSRKMMSTIHKTEEGFVQFTKGAPDVILSRCTSYFDGEKEVPFTDELKAKFLADNKAMLIRRSECLQYQRETGAKILRITAQKT